MTVRKRTSSTTSQNKAAVIKTAGPKKLTAKKVANAPKAKKAAGSASTKDTSWQRIRDGALVIGVFANIDDLVALAGQVLRGLGLGFMARGTPVSVESVPVSKRRAFLLAPYTLSVINSQVRRMAPEIQQKASRDKELVRSLIELASDPLNPSFEQRVASHVVKWALLKSVPLARGTRRVQRL